MNLLFFQDFFYYAYFLLLWINGVDIDNEWVEIYLVRHVKKLREIL